MRAGPRFAAVAAAGSAGGLAVLGVVAGTGVSAAGTPSVAAGPAAASPSPARTSALPTCPPSASSSAGPADVGVTFRSGSFVPVTAAPSYGAGVVFTNREDRTLTVTRTVAPTFALTLPPGTRQRLALPSVAPTALRYAGDVPAMLLEPSEHAMAEILAPASPPPPSTVTACVVATHKPSPSASPSRSPSRAPASSPRRSASRRPSPSPRRSSPAVLVIPSGRLASEEPSLAPIQSGVKPSIATEPSFVLPTYSTPAAPSAEPTAAPSSPPAVVDLAQPVPARHRGLPITVGVVLVVGVGTAVARAVRGLRRP